MKKLFTSILFLLIVFVASAQDFEFTDSVNISRERWRDSLLRMDMSQVPTGFLFEYSLAGADLSKFNGVISDTLKNEGQILSLHEILNLSKVNSNAQIVPTDSLYEQANGLYSNNKTVALIFIYQTYNRIRQTALSEGLFTIAADSVGILDAPGRTVSPYDTYEIFAFAPFKQSIKQFNNINFALPDELFYMQGFTSVEVDFGDGAGYRTLNKGDNIAIYYSTEGIKNLTARITTTSGIKLAKAQIDYTRPASYSKPDSTFNLTAEPVYTSDDDYFGIYGRSATLNTTTNLALPGANVQIVNGCGDVFDKPIIIVEGFDPQGDFDIKEYQDRFREHDFTATMSNYGYDFVYVDFTDNMTYIENNAKVLEAVINKVNEIKVGTNKSSIIGFSMGGLIARWCLKDMEDRSLDHQVENYFSYDAPHQGANSLLGMQYIAKELERDLPYLRWDKTFKRTVDGLRSPAARQMLVTHGNYSNGPFNWEPSLNTLDPLRASFAQKLVAKGYPQTTNNYGIAFGRGDNTSNKNAGNGNQWTAANPFNAGDQIFDGGIDFLLISVFTSAWAVPENNNKSTIADYSFGGITFRKIFGIPILPIITLRNREFKYRSQNSYDDAPGGYDFTQYSVKQSWVGGLSGPATTFGHDGHCFLPTVSALDLQNQSYGTGSKWQSNNLFYNIDSQIQNLGTVNGNDLVTPSLSPFKAVITSTTGTSANNGYHNGDISAQFAAFIERKILNANPINCAGANGLCNVNPAITGTQGDYCVSTFNLDPLPNDITINWSSKYGYLTVINGQGTATVTIEKNQNITDTLFATLTNGCGANAIVKKAITPMTPPLIDGPSAICSPTATYKIPNLPSGTTIIWTVTGSMAISGANNIDSVSVIKSSDGFGILTATITTACGNVKVTKNVQLGNPSYPYAPEGEQFPTVLGDSYGYEIPAYPGAISYDWYVTGGEASIWQIYFLPNAADIVFGSHEGYYYLQVKITTECGEMWSDISWVYVDYHQNRSYSYFPNPVKNELTVTYKAIKPQAIKNEAFTNKVQIPVFEIKLLDDKGFVLKSAKSDGHKNSVNISTENMPNGTYFLHILNNGKTIKKQVVVQH